MCVVSGALFDMVMYEGICGRFGLFSMDRTSVYLPLSFGDDSGICFTVLRLFVPDGT